MNRRYELQAVLEGILGSGNVYFQPPENLKVRYDCIVYERSEIETVHADNAPYRLLDRYQVTVIYKSRTATSLTASPCCPCAPMTAILQRTT